MIQKESKPLNFTSYLGQTVIQILVPFLGVYIIQLYNSDFILNTPSIRLTKL